MKLTSRVHVVASGGAGFGLTNAYDCTVFLVDCGDGYVLIDCGAGLETERIAAQIRLAGYEPGGCKKILVTHAHADHSGGAAWLAEYTGAGVVALAESADYMRRGDAGAISLEAAKAAGVYPADYTFYACPATAVADGETLQVGDLTFRAVATPGHSSGHCAWYVALDGVHSLFSGDCIYPGGKISLQPIWDCSVADYAASIGRLATLRVDALFPSHHGLLLEGGDAPIRAAQAAFAALAVPLNA